MSEGWAGRVFISHDRADHGHAARGLVKELRSLLPSAEIVFDQDHVRTGRDWRSQIRDLVDRSTLMLALVGPNWGTERRHDVDNGVRVELEAANDAGVEVLPVLVDRSELPTKQSLPDSLDWFPFLPTKRLRHDDWGVDVESLVADIASRTVPPELRATSTTRRFADAPPAAAGTTSALPPTA